MKITLVTPYKSILDFPVTKLPDFVIITGVNGAGKSHLLEAISNGCVQIDGVNLHDRARPIRLFNWANLVPNDTGAFASYQITQEKQGLWNEFLQHSQQFKNQIVETLRQLGHSNLLNIDFSKLVRFKEKDLIDKGLSFNESQQVLQVIQSTSFSLYPTLIANFGRGDFSRERLINTLQLTSENQLISLEEKDFYDNFPKNWLPVDMFQQSFGRLFLEYQSNFLNNKLKYLASLDGDSVHFLNNEEFIEQYGKPPWDFVNDILTTANLDFRIDQPAKYYEDRPYEPILTDRVRGTQVRFADLSSGERILMSFALCLYYAQDRRQLVDYPKVLLFDEIDAPLHPSMTQSLLRTIKEVLIEQHKIKVIMTTHSPSTVALAPEACIYTMFKTGQRRLQKATKDKALALLTTGVPTLSIDYENRRQVFVESEHDVKYYEKIYAKLKDYLDEAKNQKSGIDNNQHPRIAVISEISLNFIASGASGHGKNCDQVKEVVNQLYKSGSKTVYGIIDWDLKNDGNERVKVIGKESRYSIDSYILDPLIIGAFLLQEKWISRSDIGLSKEETSVSIASFNNDRLQVVADFVVNKVRDVVLPTSEGDNILCQYIAGQSIKLPTWFLHVQGHDLEKKLKSIFPPLNKFQRESELKYEILHKIIDDIPVLISQDFVTLFQQIQSIDSAI
jgi:ABC-type branched-subunit amino acid transport system ATPase component